MSSRPISSLFLASILIINTVGFLAIYSISKHLHHLHIDADLAQSVKCKEYVNFRVTHSEFEHFSWRRPQKEFELNGELYDIVQMEHSHDSVTMLCYKDDHEKKLDASLKKAMGEQNSDKSRSKTSLRTPLLQVFIQHSFDNGSLLQGAVENEGKTDFFQYISLKSSPHLTIHSPPPQRHRIG